MFIGTLSFPTRSSLIRFPQMSVFGTAKAMAIAVVFVTWFANPFQATHAQQKFASLPIAEAYDYPPLSIDADDEESKNHRREFGSKISNRKTGERELKASARGGGLNAAARDYLNGYVFPAMTQTDPYSISKLGETRTKFLGTFLDDNVTGAARQQILSETLKAAEAIATDNDLHPAARLNAVYLLGQLDDVPLGSANAPTPSPAALASMMKIFTGNDAKLYPQYLQIAALAGIQRNLEITKKMNRQIDANTRNELLTRINQTLAAPIDPQNAAVSYWLKRRSMQVGGLIGDSATVDQILATLNNKNEKFWLQADALDALASLGTLDTNNDKNLKAAQAVTKFAVAALAREAKAIENARAQLVYNNILFRDVDFEATGTNFEGEVPAPVGDSGMSAGGGGGGGAGGKFGGNGMGAGGPGEGAGEGGGGFGGFGGGGVVNANPTGPLLELPNYELQSFRSRIKTIGLKCKAVIGADNSKGLRRYLDAKSRSAADNVITYLDRVIENSTIGIIDREDRDRDPADDIPEVSFTEQLREKCNEWSNDISETLSELGVTPTPEAPATEATPATETPATPAIGN